MKQLCTRCKREYDNRYDYYGGTICPDCWNDVENEDIEMEEIDEL